MQPLEYLFGLEFHGHKLGLDNIRALTDALGRPQDACPSLVVAGTNGKGSVCAMASAALTAAGFRTGCYTSPHLVHIEERFTIDGVMVAPAELERVVDDLRVLAGRLLAGGLLRATPTFFEVATAAAFELFRRRGVDVAVLEVGMGGRLDATSVASPLAGAITNIALDHQQYLGDDARRDCLREGRHRQARHAAGLRRAPRRAPGRDRRGLRRTRRHAHAGRRRRAALGGDGRRDDVDDAAHTGGGVRPADAGPAQAGTRCRTRSWPCGCSRRCRRPG